jgi:glycosyltransferase involved in cell wall biosynthesis
MPVLNERAYLEHAVASVLSQEVDGPSELVLALGPSTDGTTELAQRLAEADPRIRLVDNPAADIPVGLNAAIRAGRYDTKAVPRSRRPRRGRTTRRSASVAAPTTAARRRVRPNPRTSASCAATC